MKVLLTAIAMIVTVASSASAMPSCERMWHERNSVFAKAGYCFKTAQAIRVFGNAGCAYDDEYELPLSQKDREYINEIKRAERLFCR